MARRPLEKERIYLDGGRRTTQLMRDSLGRAQFMTTDDWRLTNQEEYLRGATLHWRRYTAPRPDWDHDHCEFCWAKFADADLVPGALEAGYTTDDGYRWICEACFADFRERFGWHIATPRQEPGAA